MLGSMTVIVLSPLCNSACTPALVRSIAPLCTGPVKVPATVSHAPAPQAYVVLLMAMLLAAAGTGDPLISTVGAGIGVPTDGTVPGEPARPAPHHAPDVVEMPSEGVLESIVTADGAMAGSTGV